MWPRLKIICTLLLLAIYTVSLYLTGGCASLNQLMTNRATSESWLTNRTTCDSWLTNRTTCDSWRMGLPEQLTCLPEVRHSRYCNIVSKQLIAENRGSNQLTVEVQNSGQLYSQTVVSWVSNHGCKQRWIKTAEGHSWQLQPPHGRQISCQLKLT